MTEIPDDVIMHRYIMILTGQLMEIREEYEACLEATRKDMLELARLQVMEGKFKQCEWQGEREFALTQEIKKLKSEIAELKKGNTNGNKKNPPRPKKAVV